MFNFTPLQRQWIDDLRSGKFKQCRGALTTVGPEGKLAHCCLGVAAERIAEMPNSPIRSIRPVSNPAKGGLQLEYSVDMGQDDVGTVCTDLSYGLNYVIGLRTPMGSFLIPFPDREVTFVACGGETWLSLTDFNDNLGLTFDQIADMIERFPNEIFQD